MSHSAFCLEAIKEWRIQLSAEAPNQSELASSGQHGIVCVFSPRLALNKQGNHTHWILFNLMFVSISYFISSSWVNNFGHEGLGLLLDALEKLLDKKQ